MSINRHNPRRDANEGKIVEALQRAGASVVRLDTPGDLLVGIDGVTYLIEVKTLKGKPTPDQVTFAASWQGQYAIVRDSTEALKVIGR